MKRLLDINTWIALAIETHSHHAAAQVWYDEAALTPGDLVFCLPTELGFLRLLTKTEVMNQCGAVPLSNDGSNNLSHELAMRSGCLSVRRTARNSKLVA